ncbi:MULTISPECIES: hypothetical protein [unclassified Mammaliicoccus]|uniref:hypothetical protein n=1 Tax=Mammaliicoccus TaxID=2803850 RepID=UPI001EFA74E4|nr:MULTISPECIES: hypothetical protein [unclassified Mammaliicoccus]
MTVLNNELSKRLGELEENYEQLLRPFLNDLANADTASEENTAANRFKNNLSKYVKELNENETY